MNLSVGIRCHIYSFLDIKFLLKTISFLSRREREELLLKNKSILNQKKKLRINMNNEYCINPHQLRFAIDLASGYGQTIEMDLQGRQTNDIHLYCSGLMSTGHMFILQMIFDLAREFEKRISILFETSSDMVRSILIFGKIPQVSMQKYAN